MNRKYREQILLFLLLFTGTLIHGCAREDSPAVSEDNQSAADALSARDILDSVIERYRLLENYSDDAALHLVYRVNGTLMEEPHLWSVAFGRPEKFAARLYQARIFCNDGGCHCKIYDLNTGNLDGQVLKFTPRSGLPLGELIGDEIARYFVSGTSELPLSSKFDGDPLVPPTIGLLTGQWSCDWLVSPDRLERLSDKSIAGEDCYALRIEHEDLVFLVYVNQESELLSQIEYPTELLNDELSASPEITDVWMVARFHNASVSPIRSEQFVFERDPSQRLVKNFVALPESFPCDSIGQKLPPIAVTHRDGRHRIIPMDVGELRLLIFASDSAKTALLESIDSQMEQLNQVDKDWSIVVARPRDRTNAAEPATWLLIDGRAGWHYLDQDYQLTKAIGIKSFPTAVLVDKLGKIQFARKISDEKSIDEVIVASRRISMGDDLSAEMRRQYERFYADYQSQLQQAEIHWPDSVQQSVANNNPPEQKISWTNDDLHRPGNFVNGLRGERPICLLDGWRTVVSLNESGSLETSQLLELDGEDAVTRIVGSTRKDGTIAIAAFATLGKRVYIFDANWKLIDRIQIGSDSESGIVDATITGIAGSDRFELAIVTRDGVAHTRSIPGEGPEHLLNIDDVCTISAIDEKRSNETDGDDRFEPYLAVGTTDGRLFFADAQGQIRRTDTGRLRSVKSIRRVDDEKLAAIAIGTDARGNWLATGLDGQGKWLWEQPLGDQGFENHFDNVTVAMLPDGNPLIAIGDVSGTVSILDTAGTVLERIETGAEIRGLAFQKIGDQLNLVASTDVLVQSFMLQAASIVARQARKTGARGQPQ